MTFSILMRARVELQFPFRRWKNDESLLLITSADSDSCRLERVAHRRVLLPLDEARGRNPLGRRPSHHTVIARGFYGHFWIPVSTVFVKNYSNHQKKGLSFFNSSRSNAHLAGVGEIFDRVLIELVGKMKDMRMVRPPFLPWSLIICYHCIFIHYHRFLKLGNVLVFVQLYIFDPRWPMNQQNKDPNMA